jgi:hypothetical protein
VVTKGQRKSSIGLTGSFALLCTFVLVVGACSSCDPDSIGQKEKGKPPMLRIVMGEGGGFAGSWQGYTINGEGTVYAWSGKGARENEHQIGRLSPDTLCALWDAVQDLETIHEVDSAGSLTRFIEITVQDSSKTFSWRPQPGASTTKAAYQRLHERCAAAIRTSLIPTDSTSTSSEK